MKNYNFAENYENLNLWVFSDEKTPDESKTSFKDKFILLLKDPNTYTILKENKILYLPTLIILGLTLIVETSSLLPIINIKRLEKTHLQYEDSVNLLNSINKEREEKFDILKDHTSLLSNPAPTYLFAFYLLETMPRDVQIVDYTVDNIGFKLNVISNDSISAKKLIALLIDNKLINKESIKINRLVSQSNQLEQEMTSKNIPTESIILEISGKLNQFSLNERIESQKSSGNHGFYRKLDLYHSLIKLLK